MTSEWARRVFCCGPAGTIRIRARDRPQLVYTRTQTPPSEWPWPGKVIRAFAHDQQSCDSSQSDCSGWFGRVSQNEPSIAYIQASDIDSHCKLQLSSPSRLAVTVPRVRTDSRRARGRSHHNTSNTRVSHDC